MFFEGSEKKVEIVLDPKVASLRLGNIPWAEVVRKSKATILSQIRNKQLDAYLLSESSLFVYDHRLIMITCGSTSLIDAVAKILEYVRVSDIRLLVYERKNEYAPEYQPTDFNQDAETIRGLLDRSGEGLAYMLGRESENHVFLYHYQTEGALEQEDLTLELLMHDLDPESAALFSDPQAMRLSLDTKTEINRIFSGYQVDGYVFEPMGYSMNAISDNAYYTFHVTPQKQCSYASFETNHCFGEGELDQTLDRVLNIFKPASFAVVLYQTVDLPLTTPMHYVPTHSKNMEIGGYQVAFRNFRRR